MTEQKWCPYCNGSGEETDEEGDTKQCTECDGTGLINANL